MNFKQILVHVNHFSCKLNCPKSISKPCTLSYNYVFSKTKGTTYRRWACVCIPILVTTFPSGSAVRNHCRTHPAPCVRPRCVCSVCLHMYSFAGLISGGRHRRRSVTLQSPTATLTLFSSSLGADILVYWIGKIVWTCGPGGSRTLDFLHARRAPFPLGQAPRRRWACHPENCNKNAKCYKKKSVLTFWVECNANCQKFIIFGSNVKSCISAKFRSAGKLL